MVHVSIQSENRENFSGQPSGGCIIADNRRPLHSKKLGVGDDKRPAADLQPGDR